MKVLPSPEPPSESSYVVAELNLWTEIVSPENRRPVIQYHVRQDRWTPTFFDVIPGHQYRFWWRFDVQL